MRRSPDEPSYPSGFIVLIVALCLIIITSFIAIYFLLRERKSSDEELAQKRKPSGKASYGFPADDAGLQQKFWHPSKYRRLFSTHTVSIDYISL